MTKTGKKVLSAGVAALASAIVAVGADAVPAGTGVGNEVIKVIHRRKSVRTYLDRPIERPMLEALLRAGMAAPTAADCRPWAFVVVTRRETLNALAEALEYGKMLRQAAAAIVVVGTKDRFLTGDDRDMWVQDCSAASENILLAAESMGLGAVWLGVYPVEKRMRAVAGIVAAPGDVIPLNVISLGWPGGKEQPKDKYEKDLVHWEKW